jgi:hypothetical protein
VENLAKFPFCSKVVAAYGLEIVSNVLIVVASPPYVDLVVVSESASALRILPSMSSIDFNM